MNHLKASKEEQLEILLKLVKNEKAGLTILHPLAHTKYVGLTAIQSATEFHKLELELDGTYRIIDENKEVIQTGNVPFKVRSSIYMLFMAQNDITPEFEEKLKEFKKELMEIDSDDARTALAKLSITENVVDKVNDISKILNSVRQDEEAKTAEEVIEALKFNISDNDRLIVHLVEVETGGGIFTSEDGETLYIEADIDGINEPRLVIDMPNEEFRILDGKGKVVETKPMIGDVFLVVYNLYGKRFQINKQILDKFPTFTKYLATSEFPDHIKIKLLRLKDTVNSYLATHN
jgi:hypothetical protein